MKRSLLHTLSRLKFNGLSSDCLWDYAYALTACKFPASVNFDDWHQMAADLCDQKISDLRKELKRRIASGDKRCVACLAILDNKESVIDKSQKQGFGLNPIITELSEHDLVKLHSQGPDWYEMRRKKKMEVFTRSFHWRIVNELLHRNKKSELSQLLLLTECLEAENYAATANLKYTFGEIPEVFTASGYTEDNALIGHIHSLSREPKHIDREELIQIADYIQLEIVEKGETVNHLDLVDAIVSTSVPSFSYPAIVRGYELTVKSLAKSKEKKDIELAPYFYNLWGLTLKSSYLSKFEKTVRQCYLTLAKCKHFVDLGVNMDDADSLSSALRFLDDYRRNVWIINENYDVDSVIAKYQPHGLTI